MMKKSTRTIIFLICLLLFLTLTPMMIGYSMGYRFDFQKGAIVATGGIYVRTFPAADKVTVDQISEKPGIFSNSIFVQNLLPSEHTVTIEKEGYYTYEKTLPVVQKEVTKLENISLFKQHISLAKVEQQNLNLPLLPNTEKFILKNGAIYYADVKVNENLTITQKGTPIIKNVVAFKTDNNKIVWLATDGTLSESDEQGLDKKILTKVTFKITTKGSYEIFVEGPYIFVRENKNIFLLVFGELNRLEKIYENVNGVKVSPDNQQIMYWDATTIYIAQTSSFHNNQNENTKEEKGIALYQSSTSNIIKNLQWMNNYYIVFNAGDNVIISETDWRGKANAIDNSNTILEGIQAIGETIPSLKDNKIYFERQNGKLYILIKDQLFESERLI